MKSAASPLAELLARWKAEGQLLEDLASPLAPAYRRCARELEAAIQAEGDDTVTLQEAAALGGYHPGALSNMIAQGRITNVGRKHAPRLRRRDVPVKPGAGAELTPEAVMRIVPRHRKSS